MNPRTTRTTKVRLAAGAALTSLALLTAACGGGGFEDPEAETSQSTGPAELKLLFAGDAVGTKAMTEAGAAWASSSGNKVTVSAATDMTRS